MIRQAIKPFTTSGPPSVDAADILRGLTAGVLGGLAGAWAMNQYHKLASRATDSGARDHDDDPEHASQGGRQDSGQNIGGEDNQRGKSGSEPATEKAATAVITGGLGYRLSTSQKQAAGQATHYAFGAAVGGMYGALAEAAPMTTRGFGLPFAAGVWLVADEVAVPALGLSRPPHKHPLSVHVSALLTHLVFGFTLEAARRLIRRIL